MHTRLTFTAFDGFTNSARRPTGTMALVKRVLDLDLCGLWISYQTWQADVVNHAYALHAMYPGATHVLSAYSYGGITAAKCAATLIGLGARVAHFHAIDCVWRPFVAAPSVLSLLNFGLADIKIPDKVESVWACTQMRDKPRGHPIRWRGEDVLRRLVPVGHADIDDAPFVHNTLIERVRELHREVV
jgi:hypothetical protein